jgi:TRAP-type uncharacterized transport system fused permease subunit
MVELIVTILFSILALWLIRAATQKTSYRKWMLWIEMLVATIVAGFLFWSSCPIWICLLSFDIMVAIIVYCLE